MALAMNADRLRAAFENVAEGNSPHVTEESIEKAIARLQSLTGTRAPDEDNVPEVLRGRLMFRRDAVLHCLYPVSVCNTIPVNIKIAPEVHGAWTRMWQYLINEEMGGECIRASDLWQGTDCADALKALNSPHPWSYNNERRYAGTTWFMTFNAIISLIFYDEHKRCLLQLVDDNFPPEDDSDNEDGEEMPAAPRRGARRRRVVESESEASASDDDAEDRLRMQGRNVRQRQN